MNACNPKEYTIPGYNSMQAELATQRQPTPLRLAPVGDKTVELHFDGGLLSSDAGLVLLKDIANQLGLTRALAAVLADSRDARRIHFTPEDLPNNGFFKLPLAMKMPTMPTPCATIPSSHSSSIGCPKPVPPWPHSRPYPALQTASHAPRFIAWL